MRLRKMAVVIAVSVGMAVFVGIASASTVSVSDNDLLTMSATVSVSSTFNTDWFPIQAVVDGAAGDIGAQHDFAFANDINSVQQMVISGFNSNVAKVRIWTEPDFAPAAVTIRSSTAAVASVSDWSTVLTNFGDPLVAETGLTLDTATNGPSSTWTDGSTVGSWTMAGTCGSGKNAATGAAIMVPLLYRDFTISCPDGTQSLYFNFGSGNGGEVSLGLARISEIQAFAVPEPGTVGLLVGGVVALLAYAWKKRK